MTPAADLKRSFAPHTLVLGLGETGRSLVAYLGRDNERLRLADSRPDVSGIDSLDARHDIVLGAFDASLLNGIDTLYVSPGIAPHEPVLVAAEARGLRAASDVDLFVAANTRPVIAVTGTNGKSTVVSLVTALLSAGGVDAVAGGNLGTPVLALLDAPGDVVVLELSSFQLARTAHLGARTAVVLNVTDDHLDWHGTARAYRDAKRHILDGAGRVVINRDEPYVATDSDVPSTSYGRDRPAACHYGVIEADGQAWLARGDDRVLPVAELYSPLAHEVDNALAALALIDDFDLPRAPVTAVLRNFEPLPHRARLTASVAGVRYIDDSKATNPGAAYASLESVTTPIVWIAGGDAKGADLSPLATVAAGKVHAAVLLGRAADELETLLVNEVPVIRRAASMREAVSLAAAQAAPGDTVLLSPACASLDMFRDYRDRGQQFAAAVAELEQ
ncbi:MAG: UDP-N-acetylmuramoyl-L-alanine--D-glutamate ligase [Pseudomonadota bacterium]